MWRARLSWRSPPRLSRCRIVWPLEAGKGATPARRAKALLSGRGRDGTRRRLVGRRRSGRCQPRSVARARARVRARRSRARARWLPRSRLRSAARVSARRARSRVVRPPRVRPAEATATADQLPNGQRPQLLAQPLRRGDDHTAQLDEREPADVDGAAAGEQQHPQRLLPLTGTRKKLRACRQRRACRPDRVERVVLATQAPLPADAAADLCHRFGARGEKACQAAP